MTHEHDGTTHTHPDYDLHMPLALRFPFPVTALTLLGASLTYSSLRINNPVIAAVATVACLIPGGIYVLLNRLLTKYTNLDKRLADREHFLDAIPWQGDERVLDVGCGNGILLMGAAKRLTTGTGVGIDIFTDFAGDSQPEAFTANAELEDVVDKVTLEENDVKNLPYADSSFGVIITGLTVHHLGHGKGTRDAFKEMARVLKPGGWLAVYDEPMSVIRSGRLMSKFGIEVMKKETNMIFGQKRKTDRET